MSVSSYIFQSCDGFSKFRLNFTTSTLFTLGDTWLVDGDISGCFAVVEDETNLDDEYNADSYVFIEYDNCVDCDSSISIPTVAEDCYRMEDCDSTGHYIYIPTGATLPDNIVLYNNKCYISPAVIVYVTEEATDLTSASYYDKCSTCQTYIVSNTPTVTPTVTTTPTISVTPSLTTTPTISVTPESSNTPTPTVTPTISITPTQTNSVTPTPSVSNPHTCYIGTTNGVYRYVDCCGIVRSGNSVGERVCFDPQETYTGVILSSSECTLECDNGPMSYTFTVTGTCDDSNGGRIVIYPEGGTLPYTIDNNLPGSLGSETGIGPFIFSGLSADTYTFTMNDSSGGSNQEVNININVEGCLTITGSTEDELCGGGNGSFTVSGDSLSVPYTVYLYKNTFLHLSGSSLYNTYTWNGLSYGDYYSIVEDYGGATAQTATYTITSGVSVDYGFSITGQSPCFQIGGVAEVTGVTGNSPFTYLWNNGQTGTTATGLTQGYNSVSVTDVSGCTTTKNVFIPYVSQLGVQSITTTQSTCFNQDGTATVTVTGGTAPYYFSGSTGQSSGYISSNSYVLTGLSGSQSVRIIDSGYCDITEYFTVPTTAGFTVVSVNTTNSQCSNDGTITIEVNGTTGNITYSITGSTGNTQTTTTLSQSHTFTGLVSDTYTVGISSDRGCEYITTKTIENEEKFFVSYTGTNASCGVNNGSVYIEVSSGTTELMYPLSYIIKRVSNGTTIFSNVNSTSNTQTVTNLLDGTYEIIVTDNNSCSVTEYFTLTQEGDGIEAILYGTPCVFGDDGTATLQIINGTAPFSVSWSDNVPSSQSGSMFLSGLSGGTYTVTIFDSNGCALQRRVTIQCDSENIDNYVINTLCEQTFTTTTHRKRGFHEMLNETFLDLNQPGYDCYLESAIFRGVLTMSGGSYGGGYTYEDEFYTGYTLNDVPSDNQWETVVDGLFSNFTGITYSVDIIDNTFTVNGICDGDQDPTNGAFVELKLEIDIEVNCENRVAPTPSVTPSITPTISVTPSITPTITNTPSVTPTISITPSPGASTTPTPSITVTPTTTITPSVTPSITPTPSVAETPKALLFILEQKNNTSFAQYMYDSGSTFYGFAYNSQPSTGFDITTFMDWPGWFDGTAPTVIEQTIPQTSGGVDDFGNGIVQYNFLTTRVPRNTASNAWYIWLIPQSQIGGSSNRQRNIEYNVNSVPSGFISQPMTSTVYEIAANYTGSNWVNDTYRMYTTHPGQAFSITNNNTDDIFFRGGLIS